MMTGCIMVACQWYFTRKKGNLLAYNRRIPSLLYIGRFEKRKTPLRVLSCCILLTVESLFKFVHTTACIHKLLFAGIERMAFGANFNTKIFPGRTGGIFCTASTGNNRFYVLGMNSFFHNIPFLTAFMIQSQ